MQVVGMVFQTRSSRYILKNCHTCLSIKSVIPCSLSGSLSQRLIQTGIGRQSRPDIHIIVYRTVGCQV
ncbi:hypothetical protein [Anaerobutyricum hallii]|uniref:hypothetical protein n=1 Tax=Anaerobutyricum hallii TaxID=39488 RepID=UPI003AB91AC1